MFNLTPVFLIFKFTTRLIRLPNCTLGGLYASLLLCAPGAGLLPPPPICAIVSAAMGSIFSGRFASAASPCLVFACRVTCHDRAAVYSHPSTQHW